MKRWSRWREWRVVWDGTAGVPEELVGEKMGMASSLSRIYLRRARGMWVLQTAWWTRTKSAGTRVFSRRPLKRSARIQTGAVPENLPAFHRGRRRVQKLGCLEASPNRAGIRNHTCRSLTKIMYTLDTGETDTASQAVSTLFRWVRALPSSRPPPVLVPAYPSRSDLSARRIVR